MPCNCGNKNKKQSYVYTGPDGKTKTYPTEIEARAAVIRNGGGTYKAV